MLLRYYFDSNFQVALIDAPTTSRARDSIFSSRQASLSIDATWSPKAASSPKDLSSGPKAKKPCGVCNGLCREGNSNQKYKYHKGEKGVERVDPLTHNLTCVLKSDNELSIANVGTTLNV